VVGSCEHGSELSGSIRVGRGRISCPSERPKGFAPGTQSLLYKHMITGTGRVGSFVFQRCWVRMSAGTPGILSEVLRGFSSVPVSKYQDTTTCTSWPLFFRNSFTVHQSTLYTAVYIPTMLLKQPQKKVTVTCMCVTIDGVWVGEHTV
jgi:hypothetical protein